LAGRTLAGAASFFITPTAGGRRAGAAHPPKEGEKYLVLFPNNLKFSVAIGRYI